MRTFMFLAVTIGGLAAGYLWCFGKLSYRSVAEARGVATTPSMSAYEHDRMVKRYSDRAVPYEMSRKTERKGNVIITTTTYTPK
jgi:hypothetical protein